MSNLFIQTKNLLIYYVISVTGLSCNLTNNHNSYKDIVCELHNPLTVLREHYSFNEKFLISQVNTRTNFSRVRLYIL